jgi:hypothetical protein
MGTLKTFNLKKYVDDYGIDIFVETGAGPAWSLTYAAESKLFKKLYSVELDKSTFDKFKHVYDNLENTKVFNDTSESFLSQIIQNLKKQRVLYFLDAHFPGSEFGIYDGEKNPDMRIPLEIEIKKIVSLKDVSQDVFIIDDLRIYIDGPFEGGNWSDRHILGGDGIEFIYTYIGNTHNIELDYRDQGYIICTPKIKK